MSYTASKLEIWSKSVL